MGARLNRVMAEGETRKLWVGISACLLGERVRYDGGHKKNALVTETLGPHVEWVAICPEVELGLPIPRPAMDLVRGTDDRIRLVVTETGELEEGRPGNSYRNILRSGFHEVYVRPNFLSPG